jgi:hypothetical protein
LLKLTGVELIFTRAVIGGKLIANLAKVSGADVDIFNATNKNLALLPAAASLFLY